MHESIEPWIDLDTDTIVQSSSGACADACNITIQVLVRIWLLKYEVVFV